MFFRHRHLSNPLMWKLQLFPEWYLGSIIHQALALGIDPSGQLPANLQRQVNLKTKKFLECPHWNVPSSSVRLILVSGCWLDQGVGKGRGVVEQSGTCAFDCWAIHLWLKKKSAF